jgi:2-dehydro-3-deoxyphosphogluconate aldolase / (4S)-4-hydroxy-2-oxoglutarate aldolase
VLIQPMSSPDRAVGGHPVLDTLAASRLVPVVVLDDAARAAPLGRALAAGGLRCAEITFRTTAAAEAIRVMAEETDLMVGAGTVLHRGQIDAAVEAGARFIVSPGFSRSVVAHCREIGIPVLPGIATPSELMSALEHDLEVVKFFPAEQYGGVATVRALAGPFPAVRFVPTGGITEALLPAYLALPSVLAVGGSWMVEPALLAADDWAEVTARTVAAVRRAREPIGDRPL